MIDQSAQRASLISRNIAALGVTVAALGIGVVMSMLPLAVGENLTRPQIVPIAAGAAVVAGVSVLRIEYGILLLPFTAVAVPFAIGTGTQSRLVASMLFAAFLVALWIARMLVSSRRALVESSVTIPLLGFIVTAALATIYSDVVRDPLVYVWPTFSQVQLGGLGVFIVSSGVLLMAANVIREIRWVRWLVWVFLALGAFSIVGYLLRSGQDLPGFSTGGMFSLWVVSLAYGQALSNDKLPRLGRVGLLLLAVAWVYRRFLLEDFWLSGWLPAFIAMATISCLRPRLLSLAVIAGIAIAALSRFEDIYALQVAGSEGGGNFLRLDLWQQNLEVTKDHLLLGTGVAGYAPYYVTFFPDRALSSHSNYLDVFSQTGMIGSFFFAWFLVAVFIVAAKARKRWKAGFEAGFADGALGALAGLIVAMALGDWLIPFVYNQTIAGFRSTVHSWLFLGALVSLLRIRSVEQS